MHVHFAAPPLAGRQTRVSAFPLLAQQALPCSRSTGGPPPPTVAALGLKHRDERLAATAASPQHGTGVVVPCCSTCAVFVRCVRRPGAALHRGCAATTCTAAGAESRSASAQWNKGVALQAQLTLSFSGAVSDRRARELDAAHSGGVLHALATLRRAAAALRCAVVPQAAAAPGGTSRRRLRSPCRPELLQSRAAVGA